MAPKANQMLSLFEDSSMNELPWSSQGKTENGALQWMM